MKTVAYLTTTHGRPAITLDRARADQYAADTHGLVEELVLRSEAEAALRPWLELQRTVAEMLGLDPATWPDHGNAPLALASTVRLALNGTLRTVPAEPVAPLPMYRDCINCRHADLPGNAGPCGPCASYDNWEALNTP